MKSKRPTSNVQRPTLNERAEKAITEVPYHDAQPQGEIYFVPLLRQFSGEAFLLAELMNSKGEIFIGAQLGRYGRYLGKAARLIEDLAKEQLRRSPKKNPPKSADTKKR